MNTFKRLAEFLKRVFLSKIVGYVDRSRYWDRRWRLKLNDDITSVSRLPQLFNAVSAVMADHGCHNILDVGCGPGYLKDLEGYLGLDFSPSILKSKLSRYLYADVAEGIPLPDRSFDVVFSSMMLLHIPYDKIENVTREFKRVARELIILREPEYAENVKLKPHCFNHDLAKLFEDSPVPVVFLSDKEIFGETKT